MKTKLVSTAIILAAVLAAAFFPSCAQAQSFPEDQVWAYTLIHGSELLDDCPVCDRLSLPEPMRGTFELRLLEYNPFSITCALENIAFTAGSTNRRSYQVTGTGNLRIFGEVAVVQSADFQLQIDDGAGVKTVYLTNATTVPTRRWPMLQLVADQTNGTLAQVFHLTLNAAPFRELWFSTRDKFEAGIWNAPTNLVSDGDLIASTGRLVKRNHDLTIRLGVQPPVADLGLKDIDILPGGAIAFATTQSVFSETLGPIQPGDVLTDYGQIWRTNSDLVFVLQPAQPPPENNFGLGGLHIQDTGETLFSVETGFYSKKLNLDLEAGDLLSDRGYLYKSNRDLLYRFSPDPSIGTAGMAAAFVWPHGEVWFATAKGFKTTNGMTLSPGDLLSDEGYIVYTNGELLARFEPSNSDEDYGLDALYVVTDAGAPFAPPELKTPHATDSPPGSLAISWSAPGRVFQIESSATPAGPFLPVAPISTSTSWIDPGALNRHTPVFYRVRQW